MGESEQIENVVIIGSGPAAHTAAIYTARAELAPVLFEGWLAGGVAAGGQLTTTTDVENFPGFPDGIGGLEITEKFRAQSVRFGTRIHTKTVTSIDVSQFPYTVIVEGVPTPTRAKSIIVATGANAKRMEIPGAGESPGEYWQRGVSACAVCDGAAPIFRGKVLFVVGGGDSACEEATFLAKYASKVYIVHRRDTLRASKIMRRRAEAHAKVEIMYCSEVVRVTGNGKLMTGVVIRSTEGGKEDAHEGAGLFFAIGHSPNTSFLGGQLAVDEQGYLITEPDSTLTSQRGVFAAGDVQDKKWRQAITAAGTGCMAALEVENFLESLANDEAGDDAAPVPVSAEVPVHA